MERIDELIEDKRRIFNYYKQTLGNLPLAMNPEPVECINGYWMPSIVVSRNVTFEREQLLKIFKEENIDARVFFWPLSMQPMFEEQRQNSVSYNLWPQAVNLPSYHGLTNAEMDRVCGIVGTYLA